MPGPSYRAARDRAAQGKIRGRDQERCRTGGALARHGPMGFLLRQEPNPEENMAEAFICDAARTAIGRYVSLTTIAMFFSAVTAQTIQFSIRSHERPYGKQLIRSGFFPLYSALLLPLEACLG